MGIEEHIIILGTIISEYFKDLGRRKKVEIEFVA